MLNLLQRTCGREPPMVTHADEGADSEWAPQNWMARLNLDSQAEASRKHETVFSKRHLFHQASCHSQQQSPFFTRLPPEIRRHIYSQVVPNDRRLWLRLLDENREVVNTKGPLIDEVDSATELLTQYSYIEHFPCVKPPKDTSYTPWSSGCCVQTSRGFWGKAGTNKLVPHQDSLALMQTCGRIYLETCELWTFCFDDLNDLELFAALARAAPRPPPPVIHLQVVLYPWRSLYRETDAMHSVDLRRRSEPSQSGLWLMRRTWEENLERLNRICHSLPTLGTLLVSLMTTPVYFRLENEAEVIKSVEQAMTAVPKLTVERLGTRLRKVERTKEQRGRKEDEWL